MRLEINSPIQIIFPLPRFTPIPDPPPLREIPIVHTYTWMCIQIPISCALRGARRRAPVRLSNLGCRQICSTQNPDSQELLCGMQHWSALKCGCEVILGASEIWIWATPEPGRSVNLPRAENCKQNQSASSRVLPARETCGAAKPGEARRVLSNMNKLCPLDAPCQSNADIQKGVLISKLFNIEHKRERRGMSMGVGEKYPPTEPQGKGHGRHTTGKQPGC